MGKKGFVPIPPLTFAFMGFLLILFSFLSKGILTVAPWFDWKPVAVLGNWAWLTVSAGLSMLVWDFKPNPAWVGSIFLIMVGVLKYAIAL